MVGCQRSFIHRGDCAFLDPAQNPAQKTVRFTKPNIANETEYCEFYREAVKYNMTKYLTREGLEKLKKELGHLKNVERKEVIKRISHAASHGDLKENAGYHAAREDQAFIEDKIKRLTKTIEQAEVIQKNEGGKIQIGSIVYLESKSGKDKYQIVEPEEADILTGKISLKSPLGQALLNKKEGDLVNFNAPGGTKEYKIAEVE